MHILPWSPALAPEFHAINAEWIRAMFTLEPHDEEVLGDPERHIIAPGGTILFAATPAGAIIGTGALMPTAPGRVELTKMGVRPAARGTGAGAFLLAALIAHARAMPGLELLYLLTSHRCEAAIHLYERAGFVHDDELLARYRHEYARSSVAMRFPLAR